MRSEIEKICEALLYEGYALFPYRKNALKNRKRFNFGVLCPKNWAEKQVNEHFFQKIEILIKAKENAEISFQTRFLRLSDDGEWQTAVEKKFDGKIAFGGSEIFEIKEDAFFGKITVSSEKIADELLKLRFVIENLTEVESAENLSREEILPRSFVSTHTIFQVENGRFISLLEPPEEFTAQVKSLKNIGAFPVLIGDKTKHDNILASPIILYDFPETAANSFDNFFDGLEIDELMALNLRALTDEEKLQISETDERTRRLIERIENAAPEDLLKLHAGLR
jgi:hypothetical protein